MDPPRTWPASLPIRNRLRQALTPFLLRANALLLAFDLEPMELLTALVSMGWGFWVLMPWGALGISPSYAVIREYGPPWAWGLLYLGLGTADLIALLCDRWPVDPTHVTTAGRWRKRILFCLVLAWAWLASTIAYSDWHSTGVVIYAALLLATMVSYTRLAWKQPHPWQRY